MGAIEAAAVALQRTRDGVLSAAVQASGQLLSTKAFVAAREGDGHRVSHTWGVADPRFHEIVVRPRLGLGGLVVASGSPVVSWDYPQDTRISKDFVDTVSESEGMLSIGCVPVMANDDSEALLYVAHDTVGSVSDREMMEVERIAQYAEIGLRRVDAEARQAEYLRLQERQNAVGRLQASVQTALSRIADIAHEGRSQTSPQQVAAALREIESSATAACGDLRRTLHSLAECSPALEFQARLDGELRLMERASGSTIRAISDGGARPISEGAQVLALDTAVRTIATVAEAGTPPLIVVSLHYGPDALGLTLWCAGFTMPDALAANLEGLRDQAEAIGGTLTVGLAQDEPPLVVLEVPC